MIHARLSQMSVRDAAGLVALLLICALLMTSCGNETRADAEFWDIEGPLLARETNVWIVDAAPIVVPDDVAISGNVVLGSTVTASGIFDSSGQRVAQEIRLEAGSPPESTLPEITLSGIVESIDGNLWNIDGREVIVANGTQISSTEPGGDATQLIQIGSTADITGNLLDNEQIVAREIVLQRQGEDEQPEPVDQPGDDQPGDDQPSSQENQPVDPAPTQAPPDDTNEQSDDDGADDQEDKDKREKPANRDKPDKPDGGDSDDNDDNDDDDD